MRIFLIIICALSLVACSNRAPLTKNAVSVVATAETTPVQSSEDAADDPAIWVNTLNPENSLILGTDKKRGLAVYNLKGDQVQFLARGRLNNVDLRQSVSLNGNQTTLVAATNRTEKTLDIFTGNQGGHSYWLMSYWTSTSWYMPVSAVKPLAAAWPGFKTY